MNNTDDELEFAISQYLDGTLPPSSLATLEERLAVDSAARSLLGEYRGLNSALLDLPALPETDWLRVETQIRSTLDEAAPMRIGPSIARSWVRRAAIAASVVLAGGVAAVIFSAHPAATKSSARVVGPTPEVSSGPVVAQVSIGPSPSLARNWRSSEEVISRPSVVLIDRADASAHDGDSIY